MGYIFAAEPDSLCVAVQIFEQFCLKSRRHTTLDVLQYSVIRKSSQPRGAGMYTVL